MQYANNTLSIIPNRTNRSRTMSTVRMSVYIPNAIVGITGIPSRDVLDGESGQVDMAEIVASVDYADCDWSGGWWELDSFECAWSI